jgi:hypothetical protein
MKDISLQIRNAIFYVLVPIFAILGMALGRLIKLHFLVIAVLAITFGVLGLVLVVLTVRLRESRIQKIFFILVGASAAGIPICVILHNLVYGLFIAWFGENFWERHGAGGDEPVFFILALLVCPALFLIGTVSSIVLLIKGRIEKTPNMP